MRVSDVMTHRIISVSPESTALDAARLMLKHHISGLPVVDEKGEIVGIVSEGDFLRRPETGTERKRQPWFDAFFGPAESAADYVRSHGKKIQEVMTPNPITVSEDTPLDQAVHLMETHDIKRLPVLRRGKVVGIVTRANLVRALVSRHCAISDSSNVDTTIRNRILAEIDKESWSAGALVEVAVHDGTVDLWGHISDAAQRKALKVLAEAVPGVKEVREHFNWRDDLIPDHQQHPRS
jgi:CBS domain-containing protein